MTPSMVGKWFSLARRQTGRKTVRSRVRTFVWLEASLGLYDDWSLDGWGAIVYAIKRGKFVENERFVRPLRGEQPIPREVREYLADVFSGLKKRARGQPPKSEQRLDGVQLLVSALRKSTGFSPKVYFALEYLYVLHGRAKRRRIKCTVYEAIRRAAEKHRMTFDSLHGHYKRARKSNFIRE